MASFADLKRKAKKEVEIPPVESIVPEKKKSESKISNDINTTVFDSKKTYLVVNGKAKEISQKSKYLLDMLIIEEDN